MKISLHSPISELTACIANTNIRPRLVYIKIDTADLMNKKQWYEALFENYSEKYDSERFTKGTLGECDFIELELSGDKAIKRKTILLRNAGSSIFKLTQTRNEKIF